jgi:hypothetical protein
MSNDEPRTFTYKTIGNTDIKADVYQLAGEGGSG